MVECRVTHRRFWTTVCKKVRPMLSDRCLSVCDVSTMERGTAAPTFRPSLLWHGRSCQQMLSSCSPLHGSTILSHTQTRICTTTTHSAFIALGIIYAWSYAPRHSAPLVNHCINVSTAPYTQAHQLNFIEHLIRSENSSYAIYQPLRSNTPRM